MSLCTACQLAEKGAFTLSSSLQGKTNSGFWKYVQSQETSKAAIKGTPQITFKTPDGDL